MLALQRKHPEIYAEFDKGNFTVRKTDSKFSNIAIDQAHPDKRKDKEFQI
jgi:hypothetical protein